MTKTESIPNPETRAATTVAFERQRENSSFAVRHSDLSGRTPQISQLLLRWFTWYSRRYLRRHFNSLRVAGSGLPASAQETPLVVYSNHASWWDPLVGLMCSREFLPEKNVFVPMEAAALERYVFFKRLGAFGVEQNTPRGGAQFIRTAKAILQSSSNVLWLTPQSRFADARERPVHFKPGIGHLPGLAQEVCFVPVAMEYVFWEERLPEVLVRFGEPYRTTPDDHSVKSEWLTGFFADRLRETQDELAKQSQRRNPAEFRCLLRGKSGVGGVYDRWRQFRAGLRGEQFRPQHSQL